MAMILTIDFAPDTIFADDEIYHAAIALMLRVTAPLAAMTMRSDDNASCADDAARGACIIRSSMARRMMPSPASPHQAEMTCSFSLGISYFEK